MPNYFSLKVHLDAYSLQRIARLYCTAAAAASAKEVHSWQYTIGPDRRLNKPYPSTSSCCAIARPKSPFSQGVALEIDELINSGYQ